MVTAAGPRYPNPGDHPVFQEYRPSAANIVAAYDGATDAERHQGHRWYEDAHHLASAVGAHTGVGKHAMAGLFAAYSPQMAFHAAVHNAVRAAHEGEPVRQGQGPYVTSSHARSANKILHGEHHQTALGGAKSQDLAHLVEHGGRDPESGGWSHRAACGHQEFAIASGLGYSDADSETASRKVLANRHYYDHLSGMFHQAAQHISERDGVSIAAHHVQATANLAANRMADDDSGITGPSPAQTSDRTRARRYVTERHPDVDEGNVHLAYGETTAPAEVDTLRDEACSVCGETDAWDGVSCKVCGFVAPPSKFQDPDVDLHKQLDLRQDQAPGAQNVNDLNSDLNDRDQDGLDDNTGEPIDDEDALGADDAQPMLVCPACGYQVEAGEPQTVSTEDAIPGQADSNPTGPAAGDLCPNCGQAPLEAPNDLAEMGLGTDPNADPDGPPPAEEEAAADPHADPDVDPDDPSAPPSEDAQDIDPDADHPKWPKDDGNGDDDSDDSSDDDPDDDDDGKPAKKGFPPPKK